MATGTSSTKTKAKAGLSVRLSNLKAGWDKNFTGKMALTVNQTSYTVTSMDTELGDLIQPYTVQGTAESALKSARAAVKAGEPAALQFADGLTLALQGTYGRDNPILADFGIGPPRVKAKLTSEQNLIKATKAAATRELRGTKSAKQKAAIKAAGTFTVSTAPDAVATASISAPAAAAPAVVPASNAAAPVAVAPQVALTPAHPAAGGGTVGQ